MKRKTSWVGLLLVLGLVVAACSPAGSDATTTTAAPATSTTAPPGTTTTTEAPAQLKTDIGVDVEAKTITIGLLSDLTGPFSPLVNVIVAGHNIYWANVNANGGVGGFDVVLRPLDTAYDSTQHAQRYQELKDSVVAFGHSTGSPQTVGILENLEDDGILAIPLTWYSGWTDPTYNANLLPHGANYCLEAMNVIGYMKDQMGDDFQTIAIASVPGDYGVDSSEGALYAAEQLGLEVVYDGSGQVLPGDEASETAVRNEITSSGADFVWLTTTPTSWATIFGGAAAGGFQAMWSGAAPGYNPGFLTGPIAQAVEAMTVWGSYYSPWSDTSQGIQDAIALVEASGALSGNKVSAVFEGFVEARIMHAALEAALAAGDLTQAGVLAAAKSLTSVDFNGLAPNETYVGTPNEAVQRKTTIWKPDVAGLTGGVHAGEVILQKEFTHPITAEYQFDEACFQFGS